MNIPVAIADENGKFHTLMIDEKLLVDLVKELRTVGPTQVHTTNKTFDAQAVVVMAKGTKGSMLFIPED